MNSNLCVIPVLSSIGRDIEMYRYPILAVINNNHGGALWKIIALWSRLVEEL
jgi:hypothetical protein